MFEMLFCFFSIFLRQGVWAKNTFSNVFFIINYLRGTWYNWIILKREWRRELLICLLKFLSNFLKANTWGHGGHCMLPINILLNILKKKPRGPKLMNYAATQKNWEAKTPPGKDRWDPFHTLMVVRQFCDCTPSFWLRKIKINTSIGSDSCRFNTRLVPSRFLLLEVCLYFETQKKIPKCRQLWDKYFSGWLSWVKEFSHPPFGPNICFYRQVCDHISRTTIA